MQASIFLLVLLTSFPLFAQEELDFSKLRAGTSLFLDMEDSEKSTRTVYNEPGFNFLNCQSAKDCKALAWPDREAEFKYLGKVKKAEIPVLADGTTDEIEFIKVEYRFKNANGEIKVGQGWIESSRMQKKKLEPVFTPGKRPANPQCEVSSSLKNEVKDMVHISKAKLNETVEQIVSELKGKVGQCALPSPGKKILPKFSDPNKIVPYDEHILPKISKIPDDSWPKIIKDNGEPATEQDFIAIDAMARTLYAEMAVCHQHGLQYPIAVAGVILNRGEYVEQARRIEDETRRNHYVGLFVRKPHAEVKNGIASAATEPVQFQVWNRKSKWTSRASNIQQGLCPPSDPDKVSYVGRKPNGREHGIWNDMLKIATEAVLFPNHFHKHRMANKKHFYFSSAPSYIPGLTPIRSPKPVIAGREISRNKCVVLYKKQAPKI